MPASSPPLALLALAAFCCGGAADATIRGKFLIADISRVMAATVAQVAVGAGAIFPRLRVAHVQTAPYPPSSRHVRFTLASMALLHLVPLKVPIVGPSHGLHAFPNSKAHPPPGLLLISEPHRA